MEDPGMRPALHFSDTGTGLPTLIFVHGFGCAEDDWTAQVTALAPEFRCVTLDLPGHGRSALPEDVSIEAFADALNGLRAEIEAGESILIGHSMGCKIVREASARRPDGVAGLILIEASLYEGGRDELVARAADRVDSAGFASFAKDLFVEMFGPETDPAVASNMIERASGTNPEFGRRLFLATVGWDPDRGHSTLSAIGVPLLLVQSTYIDAQFKRRSIPPGGSTPFIDLCRGINPRTEAVVVPGCGHFPMQDAPDAISGLIRDFAKRLRQG
jgi:pimeloyl-ACP methyl ester carboxylesterase